jgi:hypothetical protein
LRSFLVHLREVGVEEPPSLIEGERSKYAIPGGISSAPAFSIGSSLFS